MPFTPDSTDDPRRRNIDPLTSGSLAPHPPMVNANVPRLRSVPTVTPVGQQIEAINRITEWWSNPRGGQVFRLFGYAGTGKTSLAQHIVGTLNLRDVLYAAFSGKAAHVLRAKGCDAASTIHSLIYSPVGTSRAELDRLKTLLATTDDALLAEHLRRLITREEWKLDRPRFELNTDSPLRSADLLVLDEVSMVGEKIAHDLLAFGTRILCLGDPAQLPPVAGEGFFIDSEPDALLTDIHRSAADSPVTRVATAVRNASVGDRWLGVQTRDGSSGRRRDIQLSDLLDYDQVIVGMNKTRWQLVNAIRAMDGRNGAEPERGDRIMTLVNSADAAVLNGQQFTVVDTTENREDAARLDLTVMTDEGTERDLTVWRAGFHGLAGETDAKRHGRSSTAVATYAQAITCHKSQGSQWERVLVVDEAATFGYARRRQLTDAGASPTVAHLEGFLQERRWLYTAVTRAAHQVAIVDRAAVA